VKRTAIHRALALLLLSTALAALSDRLALAQTPAPNSPVRPGTTTPKQPAAPGAPTAKPDNLDALKRGNQDLDAVQTEQKKSADTEARLKREIESIGEDRRQLNQRLIDTAARIRAAETQVAGSQDRLKPLDARAHALQQSLDERRDLMAEILAALQRIGRHPPPALIASPQDALQALRSAILLGAVLPQMRVEADRLIADLTEQARLRAQIALEREGLTRQIAALTEERTRVNLLIEQRQKQQTDSEQALDQERQHAAQLARQADNLKDLIAKLAPGPAARGGRGTDDKTDRSDTHSDTHSDLAALNDPGRLAPAIAFAAAKGRLPFPVNGVRIKEFGAADGIGGTEKGLTVAARPGAQITAPCDGTVVYAGPFRNYGQLLILNAGSGYHVLLAGMERISVDLGQFVVTGEPVAIMGDGGGQVPAALAASSGQPVLYVEFRKDGTPVDPGPWWATSDGEKVRG
jgi:septal ring factor EnvC (AmiA/AmiB activator)